MNNRFVVALTLTIFSTTCGCGSGSSPGNTNTNVSTTADKTTNAVTFTKVYADVLSGSCATCHAPGGTGLAAGRLDMSKQAAAYTSLQKTAAGASCNASGLKLVVPGDAAMSLLVEKVESAHPPCGTQMPFACGGTVPCLSGGQVQEIVDWINDGAQND
jgi:cytochrome c553